VPFRYILNIYVELPSTIEKLVESLRVEVNADHIVVYDLEEHLYRLISSIDQLEFEIPSQITQYEEFILFFQNQIKNKAQYYFKNPVGFTISTINGERLNNSSLVSTQLFKLRIIYTKNAKFTIDIEPYTRDLNKEWKVKVLDPKEFHIQTTNPIWRHKFYPRIKLLAEPYDEVIWTNENGHICEGSFTNIFFYNSQGQLCTPSLDSNILAGIMRSQIMETFEVIQGHYYPKDLENGFFLVNSMFVKDVRYIEQN
jgi:branched-subunit amino acid aminotransferase/4-amino-4-deoxychorismate lyase